MASFIFRRFAGSYQLRIRSVAELRQILEVPEAHWVATACPAKGLNCDPRFIACLDTDRNGRVRAQELREAISWTMRMLAEPKDCVPGADVLVLDHLSAEAAPLRATADLVLRNLNSATRERISLAEVRQTKEVLDRVSANGDGIIGPAGVADAALKQLVGEILAYVPGVADRSGERGLDRAQIATFAKLHQAAIAWLDAGATARCWGADSVALASLVMEVRERLDDYFLLCRLVAVQPSAAERFRLTPERLDAMLGDGAALRRGLSALPLAAPDPAGALSFERVLRGDSYEALIQVRDKVAIPVLGSAAGRTLEEGAWRRLCGEATQILAWSRLAGEHKVLALGEERVRAITADQLTALDQLCIDDLALNETLARVGDLERLILCQRWLLTFANNFVAMPDLYAATGKALFEQGTLIMAGREFKLSVLVTDRAAHAAMAGESSMFILYCQILGSAGTPLEVAVPVTSGTSRNLFVGKRGIFRGLDGNEYDALVTQIVTQPVSLFEAIYMPFVRIGRFITSRIEQWSKGASGDFDKTLSDTTDHAKAAVATATTQPARPAEGKAAGATATATAGAPGGQFGQILMGGGIAFAAIGSAMAYIVSQVSALTPMQWVLGLLGLLAILALPSAAFAYIKIYNRNLAVLLEASGWAMNDRLRLTMQLGLLLTRRPARPPGSKLDLVDQVGKLIAANPEAAAELARQHRQLVVGWATAAAAVLLVLSLWTGMASSNLHRLAQHYQWAWLERITKQLVPVTIVGPGLSTTGTPITFTVKFERKVNGLSSASLQITGGKLADDGFITQPDGETYLVKITPTPPGPGTVVLGIPEGAARDAEQTVSAAAQATIDFNPPPAAASAPSAPSAPGDHGAAAPAAPAKP
jgi:hypothetical protein